MQPIIDIDNFKGPVDLLVFLIQKSEIDVCNVYIQEILAQFMKQYAPEGSSMQQGSEFMHFASWLLLLKSQRLLPSSESVDAPDEVGVAQQTLDHLLQYCRLKEAASVLAVREIGSSLFTRGHCDLPALQQPSGLQSVNLSKLVRAMQAIVEKVKEVKTVCAHQSWTLQDAILNVKRRFADCQAVKLEDLFDEGKPKDERIVLFLAILELLKSGWLSLLQENPFLLAKRLT